MKELKTIKNIIWLLLILLFSCKSNPNNMADFGKDALKTLLDKGDVDYLYISPADSNIALDSNLRSWLTSIKLDSANVAEHNKRVLDEVTSWNEKADKLGINSKNSKFLRVVLDSVKDEDYDYEDIKVYLLSNDKEYFFRLIDVDSCINKWTTYKIGPLTTDEEETKDQYNKRLAKANERYVPYGLNFRNCNWQYNTGSPKTFNSFEISLKNNSSYSFQRIKYRLILYDVTNGRRTEIFNRELTSSQPIYEDELQRIEVHELRGFYSGVFLSNSKNFDWSAYIVDAKPRPGYEDMPFN